ncbi:MAG: tRNA (N6-threonylcarbamoyladenosine(37)-N6)-methyltransferase TrmO [Syntrophomonas sp.]|nr:tRNA (N6-threonylcarbamoyladenosine(37)-N6)-methyltransferase TrmO [Syntrophomonas sp.]
MENDLGISLKPIGIVRVPADNPDTVPVTGQPAQVEIFPQYTQALHRIEENSHLWTLLWFHQSDRKCLRTSPKRVNPNLPEYGVFGLRSPNRPNPIALTLVRLESVNGNILNVYGMDAIDGTPVLDIKSYYEQDIIFSPKTPYIMAHKFDMRRNIFLKQALSHHQEECADLHLAVRMALVADEFMGHLNRPDVKLSVIGSPCLADTLQGLSRARLANPVRFKYQESLSINRSVWKKSDRILTITLRQDINAEKYNELSDEELFIIELKESKSM